MKYTYSTSDFVYAESDLRHLRKTPVRVDGCTVMLCTQGYGKIITGIEGIELAPNTTTMFFCGSSLSLADASDDFKVRQWSVSYALYNEIVPTIPPSLIDYLMHIPAYLHAPEAVSLRFVQVSMDMAQLLCEESSLPSAHIRIRNFATNYILYLLDYIGPYLKISKEGNSSHEYLYRRFIADIYNFCEREHELQFYASRLCISKRYLSQIVREASGGDTPKQLIDKQLVFKIKSLLASTDSTLSQIACMLHFPDQSYLSLFFKRHASVYPSEYRKSLR